MIFRNISFRKLSLSSNNIERIANLSGLKKLKILSLGRNNIKSIAGLVRIFHFIKNNNRKRKWLTNIIKFVLHFWELETD